MLYNKKYICVLSPVPGAGCLKPCDILHDKGDKRCPVMLKTWKALKSLKDGDWLGGNQSWNGRVGTFSPTPSVEEREAGG